MRASGKNLRCEQEWFLQGAPDKHGISLRRAQLSHAGATNYWDRFLQYVQFYDVWWGEPTNEASKGLLAGLAGVSVYLLDLSGLQLWFDFYATTERKTKNYTGVVVLFFLLKPISLGVLFP